MICYKYKATGGIFYFTNSSKTNALIFKFTTHGGLMSYYKKLDSTDTYELQYKYKKVPLSETFPRVKYSIISLAFETMDINSLVNIIKIYPFPKYL